MHNLKWSDLEYVLAVATSGSVSAAARQLDVNHSTVLRRIQTFEERSSLKIFDRLRSGYKLTAEAEFFLDAASSIDQVVLELERKIAGIDTGLAGEVSVTTTDSLFPLLIEVSNEVREQYPQITFRLKVSNTTFDLDRRDADIAIRASTNPPPHLVGRRISGMDFGIFASKKMSANQSHLPLSKRDWLGVDEPLMQSAAAKWLEERVPASRFTFRTGSFVALADLAEQNAGFALLPRYVGDGRKMLVRTDKSIRTPSAELWILSHKDVLTSSRIQLVKDVIYRQFRKRRTAFQDTGDVMATELATDALRDF